MGRYEIELSAENTQRVIIHILPSPKVSRETSSTVAPAFCNLLAACRTAATTPGSLTARASFTRPIFIPETPAFSWYDTIVITEYMTSNYDEIGHFSWYIAMFFRYIWSATKTLNNAGACSIVHHLITFILYRSYTFVIENNDTFIITASAIIVFYLCPGIYSCYSCSPNTDKGGVFCLKQVSTEGQRQVVTSRIL